MHIHILCCSSFHFDNYVNGSWVYFITVHFNPLDCTNSMCSIKGHYKWDRKERNSGEEHQVAEDRALPSSSPAIFGPFYSFVLLFLCPFAHVHPIKSYYSSRTCMHQAKSCSSKQTQATAQTPEAPSCSFTFTLAVFYDERLLTDSHCEWKEGCIYVQLRLPTCGTWSVRM